MASLLNQRGHGTFEVKPAKEASHLARRTENKHLLCNCYGTGTLSGGLIAPTATSGEHAPGSKVVTHSHQTAHRRKIKLAQAGGASELVQIQRRRILQSIWLLLTYCQQPVSQHEQCCITVSHHLGNTTCGHKQILLLIE